MTGDTKGVRAVSLVTILILSILGGAGAFSTAAAAEQGSISFDATSYTDGDTVTVTVDDADLSTTENYVVNIESDTESQEEILSEDITDGVKQITTNYAVADANGDNKITDADFVYSNNLDSSGGITKVSRNTNGTVDLELISDSDEDDSIGYTRGEISVLTHISGDQFKGSFEVNSSDGSNILHITDGDSITSEYFDTSTNSELVASAIIDEDPEPLTLGPITEFATSDLAGTSLTHTESVVEIPFSEDVSKAGGEAGALTLADNITVTVGGVDVTDRYTLDADGSTDGQVVLSSETPVDPRSKMTVGIDAVNDSIDTETIEPGSVDVTVASATVSEDDGDASAYEGSTVAFVATDGSADTNQSFEVEDGVGTLVFSGRTGAGSQVFTFDTAARNWSGDYGIETYLEDGSTDRRLDLGLRGLELAVAVDDRDITTSDPIEGEISANATDRIVEVTLRSNADGSAVVERRDVTLDDTGDARFKFTAATVGEAGSGNYTVEVTDAGTGARNQSALIRVVAADVTDSSSDSDVVEEPDEEGEASFRSTVVKQHAGDVASFGIELHQTDAATVTVGSDEDGFRANATVVDRDGDGTVRVRFNTAAVIGATTLPSDGGAVFGVVGKDESGDGAADAVVDAGITANQDLTEAIEPGNYTLTVRPDMVSNAAATDTGTLVVGSAVPRNLTNWVAPAGSVFSARDDVSEAIKADRLTRTSEIAAGDVVVHRLVVPGLAGEFARQSGTPTEAFFALSGTDADARYGLNIARVGANDANLTGQTVPSSDGGDLYVPGEDNASVVADPANDTYVIAYESAGGIGLSAGDSRSVSFVVTDSGPYSGLSTENRTLIGEYELLNATVSPPDAPLVVENETNQSIEGTTTVAPGTEIEFQIQSVNGTDPSFLKTKEAVVGPDGRWTLSVDFDAQRAGDRFSVTSAVDVVASVSELSVDGVIGAVTPKVAESTPMDRPAGGGQGGGGSGGGPAASGDDPTSTATGETTTPSESPDSTESVVDSTRRFLGGVLGTFVDSSGDETLRSRLLGFDVLVSLGALTTVALFVSRRE